MGLIFLILLFVGVWIIFKSINREIKENGLFTGLIITALSLWIFFTVLSLIFG
jgi:uncharacterized protein YneF (UPF0154 family)